MLGSSWAIRAGAKELFEQHENPNAIDHVMRASKKYSVIIRVERGLDEDESRYVVRTRRMWAVEWFVVEPGMRTLGGGEHLKCLLEPFTDVLGC